MAKRKKYKLPSGTLRRQVYSHSEPLLDEKGRNILDKDGKPKMRRVYVSITAPTKKELDLRVAEFKMNKKASNSLDKKPLSFKDARTQYIERKSNVLSASTIRGYKQMDTYFDMIDDLDIHKITQRDIQEWVNAFSCKHAPKTVKNAHGLLSAILNENDCDIVLKTRLPQRVKPDFYVPTDEDVSRLIQHFHDTGDKDMLIATHLASCGTLRRSEICGLHSEDVKGNVIHVHKAAVFNDKGELIKKTTKTISSDRYIDLPSYVTDLFPKSGYIVNITPDVITSRFERAIKKLDLPHFRFHDLRHYSASVMHAIGVPDQYIMERGGWSSDAVLKQIYRGTMDDYRQQFIEQTNAHFVQMQHEMQHKK